MAISIVFSRFSDKSLYLCIAEIAQETIIQNNKANKDILMEIKNKLVEAIVKGIQEKKGQNITIADLSGIDGSIANYFVICEGNSTSQVEAIADSVSETARIDAGEKPVRVIGLPQAYWVAMDYVDVLVHVFIPEAREYYNLENLWQDADITKVPNID